MGRTPKYPDAGEAISAFYSAVSDSYRSPANDEVGDVSGRKKQELIAEEFGISCIKVRKILITTGDLHYPETHTIASLLEHGMKMDAVCEELRISPSTANSYLPYSKGVYKLSEVSAAAEMTAIYRERKQAITSLHQSMAAGTLDEQRLNLWKCVCLFQNYPFTTSGRKSKDGGRRTSGRWAVYYLW